MDNIQKQFFINCHKQHLQSISEASDEERIEYYYGYARGFISMAAFDLLEKQEVNQLRAELEKLYIEKMKYENYEYQDQGIEL